MISSKHLRCTLQEIEQHWSIDDLIAAHTVVDLMDELEARAHDEAPR